MANKIKFVKNSDGEKRLFSNPCHHDPVIIGRAVKKTSHPGMQYYFADGKIKVSRKDLDSVTWEITNIKDISSFESGTWCWVYSDKGSTYEIFYIMVVTPEEYEIKRHVLITIPDEFDATQIGTTDFLDSNVKHSDLTCETTSPMYRIIFGHIECIMKFKVHLEYNTYDELEYTVEALPENIDHQSNAQHHCTKSIGRHPGKTIDNRFPIMKFQHSSHCKYQRILCGCNKYPTKYSIYYVNIVHNGPSLSGHWSLL